jgi:hypothetical protein
MFLKQRSDGSLIEVLSTAPLFDPFESRIPGRFHAGEELQEPESFAKADLDFPSGEALPRCWINPDYAHIKKASIKKAQAEGRNTNEANHGPRSSGP